MRCKSVLGVLLLLAAACGESPTTIEPEERLSNRMISGSYAAVRAAGFQLDQVCFSIPDPPESALLAVGVLTVDTVREVVRRQEVRIRCSSNDTVRIDFERRYRIKGTHLLVQRTGPQGESLEDTATVIGSTLVLRSGFYDFVYEKFGTNDAAFYARTRDNPGWMVGAALFGNANGTWSIRLEASEGPRNQRFFFNSSVGRPPVGTHQLGPMNAGPYHALIARDTPGSSAQYLSTSGTLTITESTPERVSGHFSAAFAAGSSTTAAVGKFVARCTGQC
jgi:hypothetical protein